MSGFVERAIGFIKCRANVEGEKVSDRRAVGKLFQTVSYTHLTLPTILRV